MVSPTTAPHYTWADVCDGWKLVDTPNPSVIQERMPTGTQEVRHKHSRDNPSVSFADSSPQGEPKSTSLPPLEGRCPGGAEGFAFHITMLTRHPLSLIHI